MRVQVDVKEEEIYNFIKKGYILTQPQLFIQEWLINQMPAHHSIFFNESLQKQLKSLSAV